MHGGDLPVRFENHELPRSLHNRLSDPFCCFSGCGHLRGKENFLEANRSPGTMVARPAVQKTPVTEPIAVAIAGLLREDLLNVVRDRVSARHDRMLVASWQKERGKRLCRLRVPVKRRHFGFRRLRR